jgi:hypothetical protein
MKHGWVSSTVQGGGKRRGSAVFGLITAATSSAFGLVSVGLDGVGIVYDLGRRSLRVIEGPLGLLA